MPREMIRHFLDKEERHKPMTFELRVKYTFTVMFVCLVGVVVAMFWYTNSVIESNDRDLCEAIRVQADPYPSPVTERGEKISEVFQHLAEKKNCP